MTPTLPFRRSDERSFRHDPRMRRALARLGGQRRSDEPAGTSLYWLLRSRRPKQAALTGQLATADLLVVGCALADCGTRLVAEADEHRAANAALAGAGLDWILRSSDCLPCLDQIRACDCLIVGDPVARLDAWRQRLGRDALVLGLSRGSAGAARLADRILDARLAREIAQLRDGRRNLLIANNDLE